MTTLHTGDCLQVLRGMEAGSYIARRRLAEVGGMFNH
jgi:hypothetical protein